MSAGEVRDVLVRFLDGTCGPYVLDDFVSVTIGEPRLDAIRERCNGLQVEFPPTLPGHYCNEDGFAVIRELIRLLDEHEYRS